MTKFGMSQVRGGNDFESLWYLMLMCGTDFLAEHPGGAGIILKYGGRNATEPYDEIHEPELVVKTLSTEHCMGNIDGSSIASEDTSDQPAHSTSKLDGHQPPPLNTMVAVSDFETVAKTHLTPAGWAYYSSGTDDELSISDTRRIFRKMTLRPRVLRAVEPISLNTTILGYNSSMPIYISPTGQGRYAHKDAESIISSTAGKEGLIYCMPTGSPHEAIFNARQTSDQPLFFQLYANRDRKRTQELIRKVESMGASAIFLTVDTPVLSKRERDDRLKAADGDDTLSASAGGLAKVTSQGMLNPLLTWEDAKWLRGITRLPIVLKGIQSVEDAVLAYTHGLDGIVLSHHGGRSQDTAQAPILTLLEIRRFAPHLISAARERKFELLLDGGVRRGTDVIKALALGATAVGIGRPILYSMCGGYGEKGLRRLFQILRSEIETNMALAGTNDIGGLEAELVNSSRAEKEVTGRVKL